MCFLLSHLYIVKADTIDIQAGAALLIDVKTGNVLYSKNPSQTFAPADLTKLMTVYLASENLASDMVITASQEAIFGFDRQLNKHMWLSPNEKFKAIELMSTTMLTSVNDAPNILAEAIGTTQSGFVEMMNETAKSLQMNNTHYDNPSGIASDNQYTSAEDTVNLLRKAIKNETFLSLLSSSKGSISKTNLQPETRYFQTDNALMKEANMEDLHLVGGKVSSRSDIGFHIVSYAKNEETEFLAVILGAENSSVGYTQMQQLLRYAFGNYHTVHLSKDLVEPEVVEIKEGGYVKATVTFSQNKDMYILLPTSISKDSIQATIDVRYPDSVDTIEGYVIISQAEQKIAEQKLEKTVEMHDMSFEATKLQTIIKILNFGSVGFLGLLLLRSFILMLQKIKIPE